MKQTFCLSIVVVFLFGAVVVHGQATGTLQSINCDSAASISFDILIPDIAQWVGQEAVWGLNGNPACAPTFNQGSGLVQYSGIDATTCAPGNPATTTDFFEYEFVIDVNAAAAASLSVTYAYDHDYVVKCLFNREKENLMASFQPLHSLTDSGSDTGDFVIAFTLHYDTNNVQINSGDIIDLSTALYGKLEITNSAGISQGLDIHLRSVTADNDNLDGGQEFDLITDGCAVSSVITDTTCDANEDDTFDFNAFRFPSQATGDEVYFKATVFVCLTSDSSSTCQTQCTSCSSSRRKRRETLEGIQETTFYVTAGPFKIRDADEGSEAAVDKDKDEDAGLPSYVIAVAAVCGVVAIAIVSALVLIVLRRRRQITLELRNEDSTA